MREEANDKISAFLLQAGKSKNKKNTSFSLICLYQKKVILEMFIPPISTLTEYFTVKSGQDMDLAPVLARNFFCVTSFS